MTLKVFNNENSYMGHCPQDEKKFHYSVSLLEPQTLRDRSRESLGKSSYKNIHESVLDLVLVQHYIYKTLVNTDRVDQLLKPVHF